MHRVDNGTATPGGYSDTGDTSIGSPVISNIVSTAGINVGDYVTVSAGFPTDKGRFRVIAKTSNTITVNNNAASNQTGVSILSKAGYYTDGVIGSIARTVLNSVHLDAIQEAIVNVVEGAGLTLDKNDLKQLMKAVVKTNGGAITGDLTITGLVQALKHILTKTITNTETDAQKNIKKIGGYFGINTLNANTQKKLFDLDVPLSTTELANLQIAYVFQTTLIGGNFTGVLNIAIPLRSSNKMFVNGIGVPTTQIDDTPDAYCSTLIFSEQIAATADNIYDGATAKNEVPLFIIKPDAVYLRNSHNTAIFDTIKISFELKRGI